MVHNDMKPWFVTYTSLCLMGSESGLADVLLNMFRNLATSRYEYDLVAYSVLLKGFCLQGDLDSAMELLIEMINNSLIPTANSFNWLIYGFFKMGLLDKALELFNILP
ncbi:hypothetical protein F3Y22_tig00019423pilonHSYRG00023 [Hibiscus syriacus]|uniref:Pentatricopeptide repeat-containing protein n=1 Tax=Hibiscus syriacus TaxID=106335 RepID=A0A6A3BUE1_HIBSY|nr:hypothetical protein F3Y22_tig00019423pilonHSYRG00023 [Hibiscus syriacus]